MIDIDPVGASAVLGRITVAKHVASIVSDEGATVGDCVCTVYLLLV